MGDYPGGQERLLKQLIGSFRCQVCRNRFQGEQVRVAARHEKLWIVSVRCARCRKQRVFYIEPRWNDEDGLGDLTEDEEERFGAMEPVACDDILDMHQFLDGFSGDFKKLFEG